MYGNIMGLVLKGPAALRDISNGAMVLIVSFPAAGERPVPLAIKL